jgi:hypothetical protein
MNFNPYNTQNNINDILFSYKQFKIQEHVGMELGTDFTGRHKSDYHTMKAKTLMNNQKIKKVYPNNSVKLIHLFCSCIKNMGMSFYIFTVLIFCMNLTPYCVFHNRNVNLLITIKICNSFSHQLLPNTQSSVTHVIALCFIKLNL